jgi:putative salt-induced outer membrane protein YdiY
MSLWEAKKAEVADKKAFGKILVESVRETLSRYSQRSHMILFLCCCVCLICCAFWVFHGDVRAAQPLDDAGDHAALSSNIHLVQTDEGDSNKKPTTETKQDTEHQEYWVPPTPVPEKYDWVQLTSGEWLKGEIKSFYEKNLEFDSEKLKLLDITWKDVRQVRSPRYFSIRFDGPVIVVGILQVTGDKVYVTAGKERREFERSQLIAFAPGKPQERNYWSGQVSLGINHASGNTDQAQFAATANVKRQTPSNRFVINYLGNYTETENTETVNNHRLDGHFDILKTRKYYFRPVFAEYYRDPFQNIQYRISFGTGIGYHIINTPKTTWDLTGGPAYQKTQFISVQAGQSDTESTPALVVSTNYDTELNTKVDLKAGYTLYIVNQASGSYTHHIITTLETELTKRLDFDVSFVWDRTKDPTPKADGTIPQSNDFQLIFSLGIDF